MNVLMPKTFGLDLALENARLCGVLNFRNASLMFAYQLFGLAYALADGLALLLLVFIASGSFDKSEIGGLPDYAQLFFQKFNFDWSVDSALILVIFALVARFLLGALNDFLDAFLNGTFRYEIQKSIFSRLMNAEWRDSRSIRVGQFSTTFTDEAQLFTKYLLSIPKSIYYALTASVTVILAFAISGEATLFMVGLAVPVVLLVRILLKKRNILSEHQMRSRQLLGASVVERVSNLFQIKTSRTEAVQIDLGYEAAQSVRRFEVKLGMNFAVLNNYHTILIASLILIGLIASVVFEVNLQDNMSGILGAAVLLYRSTSHINNLSVSMGNLSRLSGSLIPVKKILELPLERMRKNIDAKVVSFRVDSLCFSHGDRVLFNNVSLPGEVGRPLILRGESGSGKTTLANLISGLLIPNSGSVLYFDVHGRSYPSTAYRPNIGYVTQDIQLFYGTVGENLKHGQAVDVSDAKLLEILRDVGALDFVMRMGGLTALIDESGKNLSGGEKRRLGIARALVNDPEILIADEIMSGLDERLKKDVSEIMSKLSQSIIVVVITHDHEEYSFGRTYYLDKLGTLT